MISRNRNGKCVSHDEYVSNCFDKFLIRFCCRLLNVCMRLLRVSSYSFSLDNGLMRVCLWVYVWMCMYVWVYVCWFGVGWGHLVEESSFEGWMLDSFSGGEFYIRHGIWWPTDNRSGYDSGVCGMSRNAPLPAPPPPKTNLLRVLPDAIWPILRRQISPNGVNRSEGLSSGGACAVSLRPFVRRCLPLSSCFGRWIFDLLLSGSLLFPKTFAVDRSNSLRISVNHLAHSGGAAPHRVFRGKTADSSRNALWISENNWRLCTVKKV